MYNIALRIVQDTAEAEDVMQESFITAFTKLDSWQRNATFGAWLKRIVINRSLTSLQKNKKYTTQDTIEKHQYHLTSNDGIADATNASTRVKEVMNAMNQLNENYRVALTLNLIEGYDHEEIANILEISYANSRTRVSRAKEQLRNILS